MNPLSRKGRFNFEPKFYLLQKQKSKQYVASTIVVMKLLGKNYTKWLIIAIIIAIPFAYLLGNIFLSRFNFHTQMPVWPFFAGPFIAYVIALSTVTWQSWRVASGNPVDTLRYE